MAARPVAVRRRAGLQRHADAVAGVEAAAAHLRQLPAGAEIAGAPFRVGLEAAGGEHHRPGAHGLDPAIVLEPDALDPVAVMDQAERPRAVADADTGRPGDLRVAVDQAGPAAPGLQRQPAPEAEAAVRRPEGLAAVDRHEADALAVQPPHRPARFRNQPLAKVRIGAVAGQAEHVVVEAFLRIIAEIGAGDLLFGKVRAQGADIVHAIVGEAEGAGGEAGVAAVLGLGRALQNEHRGAGLARCQRRTEGGVAGAGDDDIGMGHDMSGYVMFVMICQYTMFLLCLQTVGRRPC